MVVGQAALNVKPLHGQIRVLYLSFQMVDIRNVERGFVSRARVPAFNAEKESDTILILVHPLKGGEDYL